MNNMDRIRDFKLKLRGKDTVIVLSNPYLTTNREVRFKDNSLSTQYNFLLNTDNNKIHVTTNSGNTICTINNVTSIVSSGAKDIMKFKSIVLSEIKSFLERVISGEEKIMCLRLTDEDYLISSETVLKNCDVTIKFEEALLYLFNKELGEGTFKDFSEMHRAVGDVIATTVNDKLLNLKTDDYGEYVEMNFEFLLTTYKSYKAKLA